MAVTWEYRGELLVVTETGVMTNEELERAFVREALADARARPAMRVVWDARGSLAPLSGRDIEWRVDLLTSLGAHGLVSRLALLVRGGKSQTAGLGRGMAKEVLPLQFNAFSEESEALAWLNEQTSRD